MEDQKITRNKIKSILWGVRGTSVSIATQQYVPLSLLLE